MKCRNCGKETHKMTIFVENGETMDGCPSCFESKPIPNGGAAWPIHSWAAGVHPRKRKEAHERSVRLGVATEFDERGHAIFESPRHRKRYCEKTNFYDMDAGYSDPLPKNI